MENDEADLFRCAVCGMSEGDSSNFTQSSLQTNATVGCGHQFCSVCVERELSRRKVCMNAQYVCVCVSVCMRLFVWIVPTVTASWYKELGGLSFATIRFRMG